MKTSNQTLKIYQVLSLLKKVRANRDMSGISVEKLGGETSASKRRVQRNLAILLEAKLVYRHKSGRSYYYYYDSGVIK